MPWSSRDVAAIAADELADGTYVNLGIGMPLLVADVLPADREIVLHTENGILGMGPAAEPGKEDADCIDAGKRYVTLLPGAAIMDHATSFALLRGSHVDRAILGAHQVSFDGDLANWKLDSAKVAGIGGALDIAHGVKDIVVMMKLFTADGESKLVPSCTHPLTARGVVRRVYTDYAIFDVGRDGARLVRCAPDVASDEIVSRLGIALAV